MGERPDVPTCREMLGSADVTSLPRLIRRFRDDERSGVQDALASARKRLAAHRKEVRRVESMMMLQAELKAAGQTIVAGVDEVGRGAIAGPVSAAAVILPDDARILGLDDSKRLLPEQRRSLAPLIRETAIAFAVAHVPASYIDSHGIVAANRRAMTEALEGLGIVVDHVLVDGIDASIASSCTAVVDGDAKIGAIAAASILAKVERDALMADFEKTHPGFSFGEHKGYGTPAHWMELRELGATPLHRMTFYGVREDPTLF